MLDSILSFAATCILLDTQDYDDEEDTWIDRMLKENQARKKEQELEQYRQNYLEKSYSSNYYE